MMQVGRIGNMKQYIVDAFTNKPFSGNPAAVCVMEQWPSEESMMKLAMENNLSETAFIVKEGGDWISSQMVYSGNRSRSEEHTSELQSQR